MQASIEAGTEEESRTVKRRRSASAPAGAVVGRISGGISTSAQTNNAQAQEGDQRGPVELSINVIVALLLGFTREEAISAPQSTNMNAVHGSQYS